MKQGTVSHLALLDKVTFLRDRVAELYALNPDSEETKKALLQAEEMWRSEAGSPSDFVVILDREGMFKYVNHTPTGVQEEELVGVATIYDYVAPDCRSAVRQAIDGTFQTGKPSHYEAYSPTVSKWGTSIVSPLKKGEEVIAVLVLSRDTRDLKQALEDNKRLARQNALLAEIGKVSTSSLEIDEVFQCFVERIGGLIPSDRITIGLIDYEKQTTAHCQVWGTDIPLRQKGNSIPLEGTLTNEIANSRKGLMIQSNDRNRFKSLFPGMLPYFDAGLRSFLAVPLISKDVVIGGLLFATHQLSAYSNDDFQFAESVGSQIVGAIVNARLYEERKRVEYALRKSEKEQRRAAHENEVIAQIGRIISSSLDINEVYERFAEYLKTLMDFDRVAVCLIDTKSNVLRHTYISGKTAPMRNPGDIIPLEGTLAEVIYENRRSQLITPHSRAELEAFPSALMPIYDVGLRSFLSVPLISQDEVIGVMHIRSMQLDAYDSHDLELAERVGDQIAGAIANSQLYEERKQVEATLRISEEEQRQLAHGNKVIAQIGRIVGSSLDINEVYERFEEQVSKLIEYDRLAITEIDEDHDRMTLQYVKGVQLPRGEKGSAHSISGHVIRELLDNQVGLIYDGETPAVWVRKYPNQAQVVELGLKSLLAVPLVFENRTIAALIIRSKKRNAYTRKDLEFLERVGSQIAGAIANAQLHAALRRESDEREVLAEIGRIISSSLDIEQVYEGFAEQVQKLIPFDRTAITITDIKHGTFTTAYEMGVKLEKSVLGQVRPLPGTVTEHVTKKKSGELLNPTDPDRMIRKFPGIMPSVEAGLRCGIAVPLLSKDEVIGVLFIESKTPNAYTQHDLNIAERVSSQIGGAVANAKLFRERAEAEEALRRSVERFDLAVRGSSEGLWDRHIAKDASDLSKGCAGVYYSPRFKEMLGYEEYEFPNVYASWHEHIHPDDRERALEALRAHVESGVPYDVEFRMRTRNGEHRWFSSRGQASLDDSGNRIRMAGSLRDITERRKLETQLLQSQKMEALGTLTGGIAHDFNNLLTAILGYTQLGIITLQPEDYLRNNLREIERAAERAAGLTRQLLTFSRSQIASPKIINLNDLVLDIDNMLRRLIGEDIELITLPSSNLNPVRIDQGQMEQVLINLVVNARDAMPDGGKIFIKTDNLTIDLNNISKFPELTQGRYVTLSVEDIGIGIDETIKGRVFDPFFTTKETGKGTGLGLSTCYGIITHFGGNITVESSPDEGSIFRIFLPRVEDLPDIMPISDSSVSLPRGSETILLVEDESSVKEVATHVLCERGYRVVEASNGAEAVRIVENNNSLHIDLVLTDVVMPLMGGRELVQKIRKVFPKVKVLYTSGYADHGIASLNQGAVKKGADYMQKPFTPAILARKVREVLDR